MYSAVGGRVMKEEEEGSLGPVAGAVKEMLRLPNIIKKVRE